jgi:hypothetical protein
MDQVRLKDAYLAFLHAFVVPLEEIDQKHFAFLGSPQQYREYVVDRRLLVDKVFIPGLGQFRSALSPHTLNKKKRAPEDDVIWSNIKNLYQSPVTLGGKLPFFPVVPAVVDSLPSKHRTCSIDLSQSGITVGINDLSSFSARLSLSISYFPVGCAVSRVGLYVGTNGYSLDPLELIPIFKFPKNVKVTIKRDGNATNADLVTEIESVERMFVGGLLGRPFDDKVTSIGRYSILDCVNASRRIEETTDSALIFKTIESTLLGQPAELKGNLAYRLPTGLGGYDRGITTGGDRFCFNWVPETVPVEFQMRYRRLIRNLIMIIFAQMYMSRQTVALEQMGWRDQIRSKTFLHQLASGIFGQRSLEWPLSFMHCLQAHHAFESDEVRFRLYGQLRATVDRQNLIDAANKQMTSNLVQLQDEVKAGANQVSGTISNAISAVRL